MNWSRWAARQLVGQWVFAFAVALFGLSGMAPTQAQDGVMGESELLIEQGELDEAEGLLRTLIEVNPDFAPAHYQLGRVLDVQGDVAGAMAAFRRAARLDPELPGVHLSLGIAYYKLRIYPLSGRALDESIARDPGDGSALLFRGLVHQAAGEHALAVTQFQRAAEADPEFAQLAAFNTGVSFYSNGSLEKARTEFRRAEALDTDPDVTQSASDFLQQITAEVGSRRPWRLTASAGVQYDDNVTIDPLDTGTGLDDYAFVVDVGGTYRLFRDDTREVEAGYDFSQTTYFDLTDFDLQTHTFSMYGSQALSEVDASLLYSYAFTLLGGDSFLGTHTVAPSLGLGLTPAIYASLTYSYSHKNFITVNARDANTHSGGINIYYFFNDAKAFVRGGIRLEDERAAGAEFDYFGQYYSLGLKVPVTGLARNPTLAIDYEYYDRDYDNITPSIGVARADQRHTIKANLDFPLVERIVGRIGYEYIDSRSNLDSSDFEENIISFSLQTSL